MKQKITKTVVDALLPGQVVSDTQLDGFRVRAGTTAKVYSVQKRIGRKVLTRTIGRHGVFPRIRPGTAPNASCLSSRTGPTR